MTHLADKETGPRILQADNDPLTLLQLPWIFQLGLTFVLQCSSLIV